nr:hypothetical protein [Cryomorphaceae bacterium]
MKGFLDIDHSRTNFKLDYRVNGLCMAVPSLKELYAKQLHNRLSAKGNSIYLDQLHREISSDLPSLKPLYFSEVLNQKTAILSFNDVRRYINYDCAVFAGVIRLSEGPAHTLLIHGYDTGCQEISALHLQKQEMLKMK